MLFAPVMVTRCSVSSRGTAHRSYQTPGSLRVWFMVPKRVGAQRAAPLLREPDNGKEKKAGVIQCFGYDKRRKAMPEQRTKPSPPPATVCPAAEGKEKHPSCGKLDRRTFCAALGWGGVAGLLGGTLYVSGRFLSPAVLYEPPAFFRAGRLEQYPPGTVSERWKEGERVWIVHTDAGLYSLVATCTHLGCTPNWSPAEKVFKCPCHGSVFTLEGDVVAGPAPEPLYRTPIRLTPEGELIVGTGRLGIRLASQANREPKRSAPGYVIST
ncbi:MAG: hypothetical protein D6736_11330 [Nitrospinota bacterium]|nr:MAG: hypothetical protein D6736_11330 [Nitrospinota bacterium]